MPWETPQIDQAETVSLLKQATAFVGPTVSISITVLEAVKVFVEGLLTFMVAVVDPTSAALQAAIDTARGILEDLTKGAGCYFIALPVRDVDLEVTGPYSYQPFFENAPAAGVVVSRPAEGSGGNYGFIEELTHSLDDPGDVLRPQFDEDAHVAGVIFLYGASSYTEVTKLVRHLVWLFTGGNPSRLGGNIDDMRMAIPRNLTAGFAPKFTGRKAEIQNRLIYDDTPIHPYATKLTWKSAPEDFILFGGRVKYRIREVVVMRAETPILKMSESDRSNYIIKQFDFNDLVNSFYDDTIELGRKYYYAVGYLLDEFNAAGEVTAEHPTPFDIAQIMVTIPERIDTISSRGIPPDWMMIPSPLADIPPILDFVDQVNEFLDTMEEGNKSARKRVEKYVEFLETEINRSTAWVEEVLYTVQAIVEALDWPDVYVGMLPFAGKGGNAYMLSTLATSMEDAGDPNRPPFDRGDEYVGGFVVYTGSETVGEAEKFWDLVKPLFGVQIPAAAQSHMKQAHDAIDYAAGEVSRQIQILDDLSASFGEVPETPPVETAIGPDLQPSFEDGSAETKPRVIILGDDLDPESTEEEF